MQFSDIQSLVLGNVNKYGDTGTNTTALVKKNINLAKRDIEQGIISQALVDTEDLTTEDRSTSLNAVYTPTATDIDEILKIRYIYSDGQWDLEQVYEHNLMQKVSDLEQTGRPDFFVIRGSTANRINIAFHNITKYADETIRIYYQPILADLSANSDENFITKKYAPQVIEIATLYSKRNILNEKVTSAEILSIIKAITTKINAKEQSNLDYLFKTLPPQTLITRRKNRRSL